MERYEFCPVNAVASKCMHAMPNEPCIGLCITNAHLCTVFPVPPFCMAHYRACNPLPVGSCHACCLMLLLLMRQECEMPVYLYCNCCAFESMAWH